jgi:hypothetical protein
VGQSWGIEADSNPARGFERLVEIVADILIGVRISGGAHLI